MLIQKIVGLASGLLRAYLSFSQQRPAGDDARETRVPPAHERGGRRRKAGVSANCAGTSRDCAVMTGWYWMALF
ncbi:MAG: hypothetical protein PPHEMADM_2698 [uncultured Paraburkholderia sp.]|nr:MAG: hypothetical protein PPHEMADE_2630 [uncultured Paraburkholderia sp.]CAH2924888.1 MAG: hypothetical protein PPHEMADM_2698 [uncultured Paraburkholderia sp.]